MMIFLMCAWLFSKLNRKKLEEEKLQREIPLSCFSRCWGCVSFGVVDLTRIMVCIAIGCRLDFYIHFKASCYIIVTQTSEDSLTLSTPDHLMVPMLIQHQVCQCE